MEVSKAVLCLITKVARKANGDGRRGRHKEKQG